MDKLNKQVGAWIESVQTPERIKKFTSGACADFAFALQSQFGGQIVYNQVQNHFGCFIHYKLYDITGEIDRTGYQLWSEYYDNLDKARVIWNCILKEFDECIYPEI